MIVSTFLGSGTGQYPPAGQNFLGLGERRAEAERQETHPVALGRFLIEWRENGKRLRASAGETPAEALEAQKRKRLELGAKESGLELSGLETEDEESLPLQKAVEAFLKDIKTFRKPLTHQKYEYGLELFTEYLYPKSDARLVSPEDIKKFLTWRKSKGMDPGTTLYTDRVILHNFFNKLGIDNPVRHVPRLPKFRKRPVAYTDAELQKFTSFNPRYPVGPETSQLLRRALDEYGFIPDEEQHEQEVRAKYPEFK